MITIVGYRTYIETIDHSRQCEMATHPQCELVLATDRWRFLQKCADAEGCWVVLERAEVHSDNNGFRIVYSDITRITCLDPTRNIPLHVAPLACINGGKGRSKNRRGHSKRSEL